MSNRFVDWVVKFKKDIIQFFQFQFVSVIAYWADYGVFALFYTFEFSSDPNGDIYSKIISYPVGLMTSYLINKRWTFGVKRKVFSSYLLKFIVVNACALTANLLAMHTLKDLYFIDARAAQLMATLFSFSINYSGNKIWVFEESNTVKVKNYNFFIGFCL
jgi:putative flippase GtrA